MVFGFVVSLFITKKEKFLFSRKDAKTQSFVFLAIWLFV